MAINDLLSETTLLTHEPVMRAGFFLGMLGLMVLWEAIAPRRRRSVPRMIRWFSNVGLLFVGTILLRTLFPLAAVGMAAKAEAQGWGLFQYLSLSHWLTVILAILCLDFSIYLHHRLFHHLPFLWRLHRVHHTDLDLDVTTGLRFHPLEILLSMVYKLGFVLGLGIPVVSVLIFEVLLNATSLFNHGNVMLPGQLERLLRLFVVTPDMHRIHHSTLPTETNRNFGFNLPWWDYLLGTYCHCPAVSDKEMAIGLAEYQGDLRVAQLHWMLVLPFLNQPKPTFPEKNLACPKS